MKEEDLYKVHKEDSSGSVLQKRAATRPQNPQLLIYIYSKLPEFLPFGDQLKPQKNISKTASSDIHPKVMNDERFGYPIFFIFALLCLLKVIHCLLR